MKPLTSQPHKEKYNIEVNRADRWQVYHRLRELDIPCWCETNQPLTVDISNVTAAIQIWSVVRQSTASRQELVSTLKKCWQTRYRQS